MSYQKLKSFLRQTDPSEIKYYYYKRGLMFTTQPTTINVSDYSIDLYFHDGIMTIENDYTVNQISRHANLIAECEVCFQIKNEYDEEIGNIYVRK